MFHAIEISDYFEEFEDKEVFVFYMMSQVLGLDLELGKQLLKEIKKLIGDFEIKY